MQNRIPVALLAAALFIVTFAVNLQTPMYGVYASESGVGTTAVTIAFAAYVAGLMPTLLLLGGLSDRIGRRIPIVIALITAASATALLVVVPTWLSLVVARLLLGIGTALATTAGMAYMAELMGASSARQTTLIVTSVTSLGFGGGALATSMSLALQGLTLAPASFIFVLATAPVLALVILMLPHADTAKRVSLFRLPVFPNGTWVFGIAMALAWSTTGMTIGVVPLELKSLGFSGWTGLVIFLAIFVGFLCQPIARRMSNSKALALGFVLIPLGFLILLTGVWTSSIALVLLGTCTTSAASYGFTYLAALSEMSLKAPDNRARATAGLLVFAYAGFSIPVIASGALADLFGLLPAMAIFSITQIAVTALVVVLWTKQIPVPEAKLVG
jgi:MFS family permease